MITDDGQIAVGVAVADLIDTDPIQRLEPTCVEQLGHPGLMIAVTVSQPQRIRVATEVRSVR